MFCVDETWNATDDRIVAARRSRERSTADKSIGESVFNLKPQWLASVGTNQVT
jgi:hypothetical protein